MDAQDVSVMFDRLMLEDLKENVRRLDAQSYGEMKSYHNPPKVIHLIIKAVLYIFYPHKAIEGGLVEWGQCKQLVGVHLGNMVMDFDPTSAESIVPPAEILAMLDEVPHGEVSHVGSKPAEHLYNWVFVCLSLLEHTRKMRALRGGDTRSSTNGTPRDGSVKGEPEPDMTKIADELQQELAPTSEQKVPETAEAKAEENEQEATKDEAEIAEQEPEVAEVAPENSAESG